MDKGERIEQLYARIKEQEKIYALGLKMKKDFNSLKNVRSNISHLKEELRQSSHLFKTRDSA